MELQAFLNSDTIKTKFITRLQKHHKLDQIIKGQYWENGKGCAIGCTIHSNNHNCYEIELGIPEWVARLEDTLFEGMPNDKAKEFPLKLLQSIPIGFDNWQHVYHQLCIFMLEKICKNTDNEIVVKAICDIITLHKSESKDESAWSAADSAAGSAARSAGSAADSAGSAGSAADSAAGSAARSAARSAAWSAGSAADSAAGSAARSAAWSAGSAARSAAGSAADSAAGSAARSAAWSAARSAAWSAARSAAWSAVGSAAYYEISEKLIELLETKK